MKTVLIATHQISFASEQSLYNCLGVLTLASCLKKARLDCEVVDLFDYNNLVNKDYDIVLNSIVEKIIVAKPDILGFSTMTNNIPIALELAGRVKKIKPKIHTIFGGPGTAFCAKDVLVNYPQVDVVFRGEADIVLVKYIKSRIKGNVDNKVPGLVYRSGVKVADNGWPESIKNLDDLPIPDYQFTSESYVSQTSSKFGDYNGVSVEVGRGCPYTCTFCSTSIYFKRKYRLKTIDRIIKEVLLIQKRLGTARIIFNHDLFTLKRDFVFKLCEQLMVDVPNLVWKCHARLDTLDEELLKKMNDAGCNEVFVGLESATEKMQKIINKKLNLKKFNLLTDIPSSLNMKFSLSFIVGFPEEDENDIREIFSYAIKAKYLCRDKVQVKIHTLAPLVGSPLYEQWKNDLVYDAYGSIGTSDIPFSWEPPREMIKSHPEIFSIYFHLPIGKTKRLNSSRYGYLGLIVEKLMVYSISLAYEWLNESIAYLFVKNIDQIVLPQPSSIIKSEYSDLAESVRQIIFEALSHTPIAQKMYDSVAQYEIAILDVKMTKSTQQFKIIEVYYDPKDILDQIINGNKNENNTFYTKMIENNNPLYYMIIWDEKKNKLKNVKIDRDFAKLSIKMNDNDRNTLQASPITLNKGF